jgi:hypothetical protein
MLVMNFDKTKWNSQQNLSHSTLHFGYREKYIEEMVYTIFHALQIDNHLN